MPSEHPLQDNSSRYSGELCIANNQEISGWATDGSGKGAPIITLVINGTEATKVHANLAVTNPVNGKHGFHLNVHETLLKRLPLANQVEAYFPDGTPLDINDGFECTLRGFEDVDKGELARILQSGSSLLAKSGLIIKTIASRPGWKKVALEAQVEAEEIFRDIFSKDLFIAYGTLLGLVRENDLIGHDDDVDAMFLLDAQNGYDAGRELFGIAQTLKDAGQNIVNVFPGGNFHWVMSNNIMLDIFGCWSDGAILSSYMCSFDGNMSDLLPVSKQELCGISVCVPANPEKILEGIYGEKWTVPDPHFQWQPSQSSKEHMNDFAQGVYDQRVEHDDKK